MSWNNTSKNPAVWLGDSETVFEEFLLQENGDNLLQEDGGKIILEQSIPVGNTWTNILKT